MAFDLVGKTFLVTGASSGIGRGVSLYFSQLGARVILVGRNQQKLEETLSLMGGQQLSHKCFNCDLTDVAKLTEMMEDVYTSVGALDGFVHCAGVQKTIAIRSVKLDYVDEVFDVNARSALFLIKAFSKPKRFKSNSSCVFIGSSAGIKGAAGNVAYSAAKAALHQLCRSSALELANKNIRVNCLAPGMVRTPMAEQFFTTIDEDSLLSAFPLGYGTAEDIAHAAAFLCSPLARWINGVVLPIDGGFCAG